MALSDLETTPHEDVLGPRRIDGISVLLACIGAIISGFIGAIIALVMAYLLFNKIDTSTQGMSGYFLSLIGFFATLSSALVSLSMSRLVFGDKYREGWTTFTQVFVFSIFTYIFLTPLYLMVGTQYLAYIFALHVLIGTFGASMVTEILSSYRYVLLGVYGSFIGFMVSISVIVSLFSTHSASEVQFYMLVGVIIITHLTTTGVRVLFEFFYSLYYQATGNDQLGDIFARIEAEEQEIVKVAQEKLEKF